MGEVVGVPRPLAERIGREHERVDGQREPGRHKRGRPRRAQSLEHLDRKGVDGEPSLVVGLRALEPALAAADDIVRREPQEASVERDVGPPQRHQLATSGAARHGQPEEHRQLFIGGRGGVEQLGDLLGARRKGSTSRQLRPVRVVGRVPLDPAPRHGVVQWSREDRVHPPHRTRRHRTAHVWTVSRSFVDGLARRAGVAGPITAAQVRVEPVEDVDPVLQLTQRHVAESGSDRPTDVAGRRRCRAQLVVDDLRPPVEQTPTVACWSGRRSAST